VFSNPAPLWPRDPLGLADSRPHGGLDLKPFALLFVCALAWAPCSLAQSFGGGLSGKKKITLHRKLPAAVKLTSITSFNVSANARAKGQEDVAQSLSDILETEILKNDKRLRSEKTSPDLLISGTITHFEIPPPQTSVRSETVIQNGRAVQVPKQYYRLVGELEIAYQAKDPKGGHILDSQNLAAKFNREFEGGTNQATDKSIGSKFADPFKKLAGKKVEQDTPPPTQMELRLKLIHDVVAQITARLVSTDEAIDVLLARGKQLDSANKIAESGLWSRNLESLETMTPFPSPRDDAYRIYNIGVANEALAYQTDDRAGAKKFLEEAAISYGKAIDARPDEKNFLEPQTRIETAVAYYKKLDEHLPAVAKEEPADPPAQAASSANAAAGSRSVKAPATGKSPAKTTVARTSANSPTSSSGPASPTGAPAPAASSLQPKSSAKTQSAPAAPALTNQKVIDMLKGGVDEDNIIATVHDSPTVDFDLSPDGQIALAKSGVKGKILAAMRERVHRPNRAK
jgi:hypothetical protein